ncbi:MAG: hypothetical protein AAF726_24555 [Planctomycetota bacterium]
MQLARSAPDAESAWRDLVEWVSSEVGPRLSLPIREVDLLSDVLSVRDQLSVLLESEPPPSAIEALYFGLFDAVSENDVEEIGYYVAGIERFDPADGESLCDPAWWPDGRYLVSSALQAVKSAELNAAAADQLSESEFLAYAGQLGAGLIVTRFSIRGLDDGRAVVVGFDSGDFATIGS